MSKMKLSVTGKFMAGVAIILVGLLSANYFVSNSRVNVQAEKAFADKLRQITGMASETRVWVSEHQRVFKEKNNQGERDISTVPVVVAWQVAQEYANAQNFEFKTPSLSPRNPDNAADDFEREALLAFEKDASLAEYSTRQNIGGKEYYRFAVPVRVEEGCLECHGFPVGEKDPFGYAKEGMHVGELRAAFAVKAPADELVANETANATFGMIAGLITLLMVCGGIYAMARRIISRPLTEISSKMMAISEGDINQVIEYHSEDEIGIVPKK
ncbi:MAG: DUF3365 domain-containing protein [Candidatus Zixiibacteriota bacterium]